MLGEGSSRKRRSSAPLGWCSPAGPARLALGGAPHSGGAAVPRSAQWEAEVRVPASGQCRASVTLLFQRVPVTEDTCDRRHLRHQWEAEARHLGPTNAVDLSALPTARCLLLTTSLLTQVPSVTRRWRTTGWPSRTQASLTQPSSNPNPNPNPSPNPRSWTAVCVRCLTHSVGCLHLTRKMLAAYLPPIALAACALQKLLAAYPPRRGAGARQDVCQGLLPPRGQLHGHGEVQEGAQ
eukprot:scaffold39278_cov59-Phaeocystis_antarctica.AAC.5